MNGKYTAQQGERELERESSQRLGSQIKELESRLLEYERINSETVASKHCLEKSFNSLQDDHGKLATKFHNLQEDLSDVSGQLVYFKRQKKDLEDLLNTQVREIEENLVQSDLNSRDLLSQRE